MSSNGAASFKLNNSNTGYLSILVDHHGDQVHKMSSTLLDLLMSLSDEALAALAALGEHIGSLYPPFFVVRRVTWHMEA